MGTINKIITSQAYALTEQEKLNLLQTLAPVINAGQAASAYYFYKPEVSDNGDLKWTFTDTAGTNPQDKNIRGPKGEDGADGRDIVLSADMAEGSETQYHLFWKYNDGVSEWQDLGYIKGDTGDRGDQGPIGRTGPEGPQGPSGDPGISNITSTNVSEGTKTGHRVTFYYGPNGSLSEYFDVWDGINGSMAGAPPIYGYAGLSADFVGSTNYQVGFKNFNASDNKKYAWNPFADAWQAVTEGITSVMVDTSLSGDGTTTNIGLKSTDTAKWNDAYDVAQVFKTASGGFVTSAGLANDTWYLMTTSGWKPSDVVLSEVAHDTTLSGNGRDNSPLGIATNVNVPTFSAGFATNATNATYAQKATYGTTDYPLGETLKTFSTGLGTVSNDVAVLKAASGDFATSAGLTQNKTYAMTSNGWAEFTPGVATISTDSSLSGNGNTQPLGIKKTELDNWNEAYAVAEAYKTASGDFLKTVSTDGTTISGNGATTPIGLDGSIVDEIHAKLDTSAANYLPLSGGTIYGETIMSGGQSNFDYCFLKFVREGNNGSARIGLASTEGMIAIKACKQNSNDTCQINIQHASNTNEMIQVQKNGNGVGYLIPADIRNSESGLTDDGVLHIILDS